jgi:hypothetical protein
MPITFLTVPTGGSGFSDFEQILAEGVEIETCIHRGRPFGQTAWMRKTVVKLSLESSLRPTGRPKKEKNETFVQKRV